MYFIQNINDIVATANSDQDFINYVKNQTGTDVLFLEDITQEDILNSKEYVCGQYLLKNDNEIELVEKIEKTSNMFFGSTFTIRQVNNWKLLSDCLLKKPTPTITNVPKRKPLPEIPTVNVEKWKNEYTTFNEDDIRHQYITNAIKMYDLTQDGEVNTHFGNRQKYNLNKFIVKNNACVAGSFPLSRLLMSLGKKCKSGDMDIYVKDSKELDIEQYFMPNAKLVYDKYRYSDHEYTVNNNNKIVKIYRVIDSKINKYGIKIDIIVIDSSVRNLVKYIDDSFDLDFCKTIYTSSALHVYHYKNTIEKKGCMASNMPIQCLTEEYYDKMKAYEANIINYREFLNKLPTTGESPHLYLARTSASKREKVFDPLNCLIRLAKYQYRDFDIDSSKFSLQLVKLYEE